MGHIDVLEMGQVLTTSKFPGDTSRVCRNGHIRSAAGEGPRFLWYVLQISRMTFALSTFHKPQTTSAACGNGGSCQLPTRCPRASLSERTEANAQQARRRRPPRSALALVALCVPAAALPSCQHRAPYQLGQICIGRECTGSTRPPDDEGVDATGVCACPAGPL